MYTIIDEIGAIVPQKLSHAGALATEDAASVIFEIYQLGWQSARIVDSDL